MRVSKIVRHVANVSLLAALALLVLLDLTAPTLVDISIFTVRTTDPALYNGAWPTISYGIFGFCVEVGAVYTTTTDRTLEPTGATCSNSSVGYDASTVINHIYGYRAAPIADDVARTTSKLTSVLVLVPIATASCALALGLGLYSLWRRENNTTRNAALTAAAALVTLAMAVASTVCAWRAFRAVRSALAEDDGTTTGEFDGGMAALVGASVFLFLGTVLPVVSRVLVRREELKGYGKIGK